MKKKEWLKIYMKNKKKEKIKIQIKNKTNFEPV